MPDGRLKLLDGHLRRDIDPEMEVDVEILDVNDEEAKALLLSIDPLASLAETQNQIRDRLLELTPAPTAEIEAAWRAAAEESVKKLAARESRAVEMGPQQWLVVVRCRDEKQQVELLGRFQGEGLECKALVG
jgi:hypothetical protein